MEQNKPNSVFEKLDSQGDKIKDISSKLEGISIDNLYILAKRTWDYGDYQTAQKYYNHISLLRLLDWEAPLYASLCNFKGYVDVYFLIKIPEQEEKIFVSTINYINKLNLDENVKASEMARCLKIICDSITQNSGIYFKNKQIIDSVDGSYIFKLENYLINMYQELKKVNVDCVNEFRVFLVEECLMLAEKTKKISGKLTKELCIEFLNATSKKYDFIKISFFEKNKTKYPL